VTGQTIHRDPWLDRDGCQDGLVETVEILGRYDGPRGEVILRHRFGSGPVVEELIVNGAFAMDSSETLAERTLGELAVDSAVSTTARPRLLVGGLGLGYTASEILAVAAATGVDVHVDVIEIEECLIDWARAAVTPTLAALAADPRVRLHAGDIRSVLSRSPDREHRNTGAEPRTGPFGPWDAIVLDVDNGPDFLIHGANRALYTQTGLRAAWEQLGPGGTLAIWCQGRSALLHDELRRLAPSAREILFDVSRGERRFAYAIYTVNRT
jgi:spermidine synthase